MEKGFSEKTATMKRSEYSPLGSGLKKQSDIEKKKQYQRLNKVHRFNRKGDKVMRKTILKKYKELDLVYNKKFSLY